MDLDSPNAPYSVPGPGHRFEGSTDRHIFQSRVCKQKHRLFWPVAPATPGRLSKQSLEGPGDPGSVVDMIYIYIHIYIYISKIIYSKFIANNQMFLAFPILYCYLCFYWVPPNSFRSFLFRSRGVFGRWPCPLGDRAFRFSPGLASSFLESRRCPSSPLGPNGLSMAGGRALSIFTKVTLSRPFPVEGPNSSGERRSRGTLCGVP